MSKPIFERAYVAKQRAIVELEYGGSLDSINDVFNFALEELPVQHRQHFAPQNGDAAQSLTFNLAGGHTITMTDMVQFSSQEGVFEGVKHPLSSFGDAILRAHKAFPHFDGMPEGLPPVLHTSPDSVSEKNTWIAVPPICTVAMFESVKPAEDPTADSSAAVFIWFQDSFGIALDDRTKQQIQGLDWSVVAVDGWL